MREGYSNIRIGMFLEIATTLGALLGAYLATRLPTNIIGIIFGLVLLFSAYFSSREPKTRREAGGSRPSGTSFEAEGSYPPPEALQEYRARRVPRLRHDVRRRNTFGIAGHRFRRDESIRHGSGHAFPFKVSTTTSNFMIGVTAAASAGIYFSRGYIDPGWPCP